METKTCTKCGAEKPATFEFFYHRKGTPDGLRADCRDCCNKRNRKWVADNADHHRKLGRARTAKYRAAHREELLAKWRERYHSDAEFRDYWNAIRMEHHRRDLEHQKEVHRSWWHRHRDEIAELRRRRWAEEPDRHRLYGRRRRARKLAAGGSHTAADVSAQYKRQRGRCYYCGEHVGTEYHVDHVIPLARGGGDGPDNIVISCPACNLRKNAKLPHECSGRLC